jgi:hypothetical protein
MNHKVKRSPRLPPIWGDPLAPARNGCAMTSGSDSGPTLCHRLPSRFRSTIAPKTATDRAREALAPAPKQCALDRIPKNEPASQAA